jgi:hypothetical protein
MKHQKQIHKPGSLMDRRPVSPEMMARLERCDYEASPERYARKVWAQISRWAEG